jgi:NADPH:quinone reductase-like Zn-dependent oxidoreductase
MAVLLFSGETSESTRLCSWDHCFPITGSKKMGILMLKPNKDLAFMKELIAAGKVVPVIDKRYPLSKVPEALRYFGKGEAKGKVVITVENNDKTQ